MISCTEFVKQKPKQPQHCFQDTGAGKQAGKSPGSRQISEKASTQKLLECLRIIQTNL